MNPREPALPRPVAMRLAGAEYDRCAQVFRSLTPAQWAAPTDCPAWDVRQMAAHMLGMAEMAASIRENLRQQPKAAKAVAAGGGLYIKAEDVAPLGLSCRIRLGSPAHDWVITGSM